MKNAIVVKHAPFSLFLLLASACGVFTLRATDAVRSRSSEDLECDDVTIDRGDDGSYRATGCGKTRRYVCDRDIATAVGKAAAITAVGCRPAPSP
jgi:hypothetical protein